MLRLPREGFSFSSDTHNGSLDALVEWIEASITFSDERITQSDIIDILTEEQIYRRQDLAREWVETGWLELSRRQRILGAYSPFLVNGRHVNRRFSWQDTAAYSFCLLLAIQVRYRSELNAIVDPNYNEQGMLFERLTVSALKVRGMAVHSTAWSKAASTSIRERVAALSEHLGEPAREDAIEIWADPEIKDGGLDVVCHFPFPDGWGGRPLYLIQCASGENWRGKKATPKLALWKKIFDFTTEPRRGIAIPFVLLEDEFRREANDDLLSFLLDRHRVGALPFGTPATWPEAELRHDLNAWSTPRVLALPAAE